MRVADVFSDAGVASATVAAEGGGQATSDASGAFSLQPSPGGTFNITVSAPGYVQRRTRLALPGNAVALSLIPTSFDLAAFDAMARTHEGQLVRWTSTPNLIFQRNLLDYSDDAGGSSYMVLNESLSDADLACLETRAREAVGLMSGNALAAGTSTTTAVMPGTRVDGTATGAITVWAARNLGGSAGRGGISYRIPALTVAAGIVFLEVAQPGNPNQASCAGNVNVLRHEIGHALGYQHVETRASVMQPVNAPAPTPFDQQAFTVFYKRGPGNSSPDTDTATFRANAFGRLVRRIQP